MVSSRPYFSARDVIMLLCDQDKNNAARTWRNLSDEVKQEVEQNLFNFQFAGQGQSAQPVLTFTGVMSLIQVLPGERAKLNRLYFSDTMTRFFAGDPTMAEELAAHARSNAPLHALAREELAAVGGGAAPPAPAAIPVEPAPPLTVAAVREETKLRVAFIRAKRDVQLAEIGIDESVEMRRIAAARRLAQARLLKLEVEIKVEEADIKLQQLKRKRGANGSGVRAGVYVLELKDSHFYVGKSKDIDERIAQHRVKRPVVRELPPLTDVSDRDDLDSWERIETLARMKEHGVDSVRGWAFTQPWLSAADQYSAVTQVCERFDLCRRCGRSGHFVTECFAKAPATWLPKVFAMPPAAEAKLGA